MNPHNIWNHIGGTSCFLRTYLHPIKVIPKPCDMILAQAISVKILIILGRTHSLVVPSSILFTHVIKTWSITNKGNIFIYKNQERTVKNAKTKLYLQKRTKNNRKYQNGAIFTKTKKEQLKMEKRSYNKTSQHILTIEWR